MDNNLIADYSQWEKGKDFPEFMDEVALSTISKGYLLPGETPKKAYRRGTRCTRTVEYRCRGIAGNCR